MIEVSARLGSPESEKGRVTVECHADVTLQAEEPQYVGEPSVAAKSGK